MQSKGKEKKKYIKGKEDGKGDQHNNRKIKFNNNNKNNNNNPLVNAFCKLRRAMATVKAQALHVWGDK